MYVKHCDAYTEYQTTIDRIETMNCQIVGGLQEVNNKRTEENTEVINQIANRLVDTVERSG